MKTDTPRTDTLVEFWNANRESLDEIVPADFARRIEREMTTWKLRAREAERARGDMVEGFRILAEGR